MAESTQGASFAEGGNPQNVSNPNLPGQQGGGEQQSGAGPRYLTVDEAVQMMQQLEQRVQSMTDKKISRVEKVMQAAKEQGVQLTQAQARSLVDTLEASEPRTVPQQHQPGPSRGNVPSQDNQETPGDAQPIHPVILTAIAMMEEEGVQIEEGDPELELVDQKTTSQRVFLNSIQTAIDAKKQRLAQAGNPARMPSIATGGNAYATGGSKASLTNELNRLLYADGQKDWAEIARVKRELAKFNT